MIFVKSVINEGIKAITVARTNLIGVIFVINEWFDEIKKKIQAIWSTMQQFYFNNISFQVNIIQKWETGVLLKKLVGKFFKKLLNINYMSTLLIKKLY